MKRSLLILSFTTFFIFGGLCAFLLTWNLKPVQKSTNDDAVSREEIKHLKARMKLVQQKLDFCENLKDEEVKNDEENQSKVGNNSKLTKHLEDEVTAFKLSPVRKAMVKEEVDECWKEGNDWNLMVRENELRMVENDLEGLDQSLNINIVDETFEKSSEEEDSHSNEDSNEEEVPTEIVNSKIVFRNNAHEIETLRSRIKELKEEVQHEKGLRISYQAEYFHLKKNMRQSPRQFELPQLRKTPRGSKILHSARSNGSASSGQKFVSAPKFGRHMLKQTQQGKKLLTPKSGTTAAPSENSKVPRLALDKIRR